MNTASATAGRRWFAAWYPWMMSGIERAGQAGIRHDQLVGATGRVLEIGPGSGFSVPHYPSDITELVLLEPNPAFREGLSELVRTLPIPATVIDGDAHELPFPDSSFDTVTASLVFCSVDDPARALAEVHRVLRPGGRFLFHEHVRGGSVRGVVQDLLTPLQRRLADGCRPNRDFESLLRSSPLDLIWLTHRRMPTWLPTIVPLVLGYAARSAEVGAGRVDALIGQHHRLDSPVAGLGAAEDVAGVLQVVDETGDVGQVAIDGLGEITGSSLTDD